MSARILAAVAVLAAAIVGPVQVLRADTASDVAAVLPAATASAFAGTAPGPFGDPAVDPGDPAVDPEDPAASDPAVGDAALGNPSPTGGPTNVDIGLREADGAAVSANKYVPITPTRVLDTRYGVGGWSGKVPAQGNLPVAIVGAVPAVPSNATAVVLNLTVTEPESPSFVTVFPANEGLPNASSVNIETPGQTIANLVTVRLGGGAIRIYTQTNTHLLADVAGYFVPASTATSGRYQVLTPTRLLDTRSVNAVRSGALGGGEFVNLDVAGLAGLPRDATAAVLNLTATEPVGGGYVSITPLGAELGSVSNINVSSPGQTIANQVITPLNNGWATVYAAVGTHVLVDLAGWFTGPSGASSGDGLFVPLTPGRLLDSRDPSNSPLGGAKPGANATVDVATGGRKGIFESGVSAVVVNATATDTSAAGFFTLFGAGLGQPWASNLNANFPGQTIPNHAIVPVSTSGLSFFTSSGANLIVDAAGFFTGTTPSPQSGYTPNGSGPPSRGPHTFLYRMSNGTFARWNPCAAIPYRVNYSGAPSFARSEVDKAVAKIEAATGLDLVNLGDTTAGNDRVPPSDSKAVISFVSPAEAPSINGVAGLGGGSYYQAWNGYDPYVAQGFVHINQTLNYSEGTGSTGLEGLLLHEIGHMIGLDHVNASTEVMYPTMHNLPSGGYGPGDLEGLWHLGAAQGCLNTAGSLYGTQSSDGVVGPQPVEVVQSQIRGAAGSAAGTASGPQLVQVLFCGIGANPAIDPAALDTAAASGEAVSMVVGTTPSPELLGTAATPQP